MTLEALKEEITADIAAEVKIADAEKFNENLLASKVGNAIREVKRARRYPSGYTQELIEDDMENYYSIIRKVAMFDYNQIGAEGQASYSADGATMQYLDRDKLFSGIIPLGSVT